MKIISKKDMDLKKFNLALKNVEHIRTYCQRPNNTFYKQFLPKELHGVERVEYKVEKEIPEGGVQGAEGLKIEVYKLPFDGLFLKLDIKTDSYGDHERISGMEFVKPIKKEVTAYTSI